MRRSTDGRRLTALASSALLAAALGGTVLAPVAAQDAVATSGWGELGDVTLRVAAENASIDSLTPLTEQFMEQYPNVTVEVEYKSFDDHMSTVLNVADLPDAPDILLGNQGYVTDGTLVGAGLIANLDPYYEAHGWHDWYGEGAKDQFRFTEDGVTFGEGPLWGISESADFVGVFYNAAKLSALGVEPPTTFAEFEAALAAAAEAGELPIKLGNLEGWPATHPLGIVQGAFWPAQEVRDWVFGVDGADYASPANLMAVQTFKSWVDNGWLGAPADVNGLSEDDAWQQFADGEGVFLLSGSWLTGRLFERMGEDVGFIAPPPGESGKVVAVAALSLPFHISSKSANPDLAAGYLDFIMDPDKGQVYFDAGRIPASAGSVGEPPNALTEQVAAAWSRIAADDGLIFFQDWASDTMISTLGESSQELIGGRITPEDFVANVQEDWVAFHADR
jgi:raffinose/stachyose/melibiose transport system substrate-binding protein